MLHMVMLMDQLTFLNILIKIALHLGAVIQDTIFFRSIEIIIFSNKDIVTELQRLDLVIKRQVLNLRCLGFEPH